MPLESPMHLAAAEFSRYIYGVQNEDEVPIHTKENWSVLIEVASNYLSCDFTSTESRASCLAACQFFHSILHPASNTIAADDSIICFNQQALSRSLIDQLKHYTKPSTSQSSSLPRVSHLLGVVSDLISKSTSDELRDRFVCYFDVHYKALSNLLENVLMSERHSPFSDEAQVLVYEILRFVKCILKHKIAAWLEKEEADPSDLILCHVSALRRILLRKLYGGEVQTSPFQPAILSHPIMASLLLHSLRSVSKSLTKFDTSMSRIRSLVDDTWITLISDETPAMLLAHDSVCATSPEFVMIDSDVCLRILLWSCLEIGSRIDPADTSAVSLFRSLRTTLDYVFRRTELESASFETRIVTLLSGDDRYLFEGLNFLLTADDRLSATFAQKQLLPDIHWLFAEFARSIDYSAHMLIDWMVSPETDCLAYLVFYLRHFRENRGVAKCPWCSRCDQTGCPMPFVREMFEKASECLRKLHSDGNVPFSPLPLIRSLDRAVEFLSSVHS